METSTPFLALALLSLAFAGCSSITDLGVIEIAPNAPRHVKIGGADWTFTEWRDASGKQKIFAESAGRKVTQKDIGTSSVSPDAMIGSTIKEAIDLTDVPTGREVTGYFGGTLARYTLKHDDGN